MRTSLLSLCLFLFACRATSVIVDSDGDPVRNAGGSYYLVPVSNSGGLRPAALGRWPTPVVLDTSFPNGVPVKFSSPFRIAIISSTFLLNIQFVSHLPIELVWKVEPEAIGLTVNLSPEQPFVGPFKVEPVETGYKIVYYHQGGDKGVDVGIVPVGDYYRLVLLDGAPFIFKIKKATESSARLISIV